MWKTSVSGVATIYTWSKAPLMSSEMTDSCLFQERTSYRNQTGVYGEEHSLGERGFLIGSIFRKLWIGQAVR